MQRAELDAYLDQYLDVAKFRDYCPNGLQVEGTPNVESIVTGVTASAGLITAAIEARAHAVLVHHGYFWRGEDQRIVGMRRRRIALLIENNINLYAFHLPLDAHAEVGNNVALAQQLGLLAEGRCGEQDLVFHGRPETKLKLSAFAQRSGLSRRRNSDRGRRVRQWRSFGADRSSRARKRCCLYRRGPSCDRALRRAGSRRTPCTPVRRRPHLHRRCESGVAESLSINLHPS
jgi:putative NIF3 family GTP cyclohydrolase 1 type 2